MHHVELRETMRDLGLGVTQLARAVGVTRSAVGYWLAGKRRIPADVVRLVRIARRRGYWKAPGP